MSNQQDIEIPDQIIINVIKIDFLWECFNAGIINIRNIKSDNKILPFHIGLENLTKEIEQSNEVLLKSKIPTYHIYNLNIGNLQHNITMQYKNEFNKSIRIFFNYVTDPTNGNKHIDITLPAPGNFKYNEKAFKAYKNIWTPMATKIVLSLGPKFIYSSKINEAQINEYKDMIHLMEQGYYHMHPDHEQITELKILINDLRFDTPRRCTSPSNNYNNITAFLRRCLYAHKKFMSKRIDLTVVNADKGSIMVIISKNDYKGKINEHIYENIGSGIYTIAPNAHEDIIKNLLLDYNIARRIYNEWIDENKKISLEWNFSKPKMAKMQEPVGNWFPKIYGTLKLQKPDTPIRPIIADHSNILEKIQSSINPILMQYISKYNFIIKNSTQLINNINHIKNNKNGLLFNEHHRIYTIDFTSMYTNIDINQCLHIIQDDYYSCSIFNFGISKDNLITLLKICLTKFNYIQNIYENPEKPTYLRQSKGIPMGGKLSYGLSEITTSWAIQLAINDTKPNEIIFLYKYVDDIILACSPETLHIFIRKLSNLLPNMPFKITHEDDKKSLAYLNIWFTRDEFNLKHAWYHKTFASKRMIDHFSEHKWQTKISVYQDIYNQATHISNYNHLQTQYTFKHLMRINHFPNNIIKNIIKSKNPTT